MAIGMRGVVALLALGCQQAPPADEACTVPQLDTCVKAWVDTGDRLADSLGRVTEVTGPIESYTTAVSQCEGSGPATLLQLRMLDGADDLLVGATLPPGLAPSLEVGQTVSVKTEWKRPSPWSAPVGELSVRNEAGELLLWVATGHKAASLSTPELSVSDGPAHCTVEEDCGSWQWLDLDVTVDGTHGIVEYGATMEVGGYAVAHVGNEQQLSTHGCADWSVAHAAIAAVRQPDPTAPQR